MTVMFATVRHTDGYERSYVCGLPDKTPAEAFDDYMGQLARGGARPDGNPETLTITTHTPTVEVVRQFKENA